MRYDTTIKDVFRDSPQQILLRLTGKRAIRMLPVEFPSTQKRCPDLVFLLEDGSIFHLELQSTPETMVWRMLNYYALIRLRYPNRKL
ncbi:MAG: flagellar biosynthesis/type III secretory pathway protein, partial [Magnetococcales bacterium]|nr:flagellar biosynthesis/type III secretory pathway protein [Magnetococcales bacterium]